MNAKRGVGLALLIVVLAGVGCAGPQRERLQAAQGMSTELDAATVIQSTEAQGKLLKALVQRANLKDQTKLPPNESSDWYEVAEAGFGFIDEQCEKYLDAMFWYNRYQTSLQRQISVTGAVTASVMGILDASATAIALTAAAFGLTAASVDNYSSQILFDLEPSGVKSLVDRSRAQFRNAAASTTRMERINTRPRAMSIMQGYLSLCLPATIETQVNGAVAETGFTQDTTTSDSIVPILRRVGGTELQANAQRSTSDAEKALEAELKAAVGALRASQEPGEIKRQKLNVPAGFETAFEVSAGWLPQERELKTLQRAMCMPDDDVAVGKAGPKTRSAIKIAEMTLMKSDEIKVNENGLIDKHEYDLITNIPDCKEFDNVKNYFEKVSYGTTIQIKGLIDIIQELDQECLEKEATLVSEGALRLRITKLRGDLADELQKDQGLLNIDDQLTPALDNLLTDKTEDSATIECP